VQAVCEEYLAREGDKLRTVKKRVRDFQQLIYPRIGALPIGGVTRRQVTQLIDAIEDKHGSRRADLALGYLRRTFNWYALRVDDFWSPIVKGMGRYSTRDHARARTLTDDELRAIWRATETALPFHALVRFSLLTAGRPGEIAGIAWSEIVDGVWNLPAARNKTKVDLSRPLSKAALAIAEAQPRIGGGHLVFTNDGVHRIDPGKPKATLSKASGTGGWTMYDLRRTSRTLMSRAGVPVDHSERCLGHVIGGVRGTYDKHRYQQEMAAAYAALAGQLDLIVRPPTDNVRPLRRRG
jgi:integrase